MFTFSELKHIESIKDTLKYYGEFKSIRRPGYDLAWAHVLKDTHGYITGGCIASLLQGEPVKDIDIYFRDNSIANRVRYALETNFSDMISTIDRYYFHDDGTVSYKNDLNKSVWQITMTSGHSFISNLCGEPHVVKASFDYVHCMPHYDIDTDSLYISERQYLAICNKELIVNNCDAVKPYRQKKFLDRGYRMPHTADHELKI